MALTRITKGVIKPNENYDTHNINSTGIVTAIGLDINGNGDISGNLNVGGVLTYEDVTSIDSVGIITAQSDIHVGGGVSAVGVGTFGGLDISGDLDVDGHTNLDNVSVAGVTTIASGGKLSIGGVVPTELLHIADAGNPYILIEDTNGDNQVGVKFKTTNYNWIAGLHGGVETFKISKATAFGTNDFFGIDGAGVVSIEKDLDVDGHTNLDNVSIAGISTFSDDVKFDGATAGRDITFDRSVNRLNFADNADLTFGDSNDLIIVHNGNHSLIQDAGQGNLSILSDSLYLQNTSGSEVYLRALDNTGALDLYHNNEIRLTTTSAGISIPKDLDVDGHTNLDNVSVAGITTFSNGPIVPNGQYYRGIINSGSQEKIIGGYISGTDTLRIGESMYLTSQGLGIGESSPGEELHITAATPVIRLEDSDTSRQSQIVGVDGNLRFDADNGNAQADTNITFRTDGTEKLRIESGGNVRISDEHLRFDTSGKGIIFGIDGGSNRPSIIGTYASSSDNHMVFNTTGDERLRIDSSGRLLMGITSSSTLADGFGAAFQIQGTSATSSSISITRNSAAENPPYITFAKSRGTSVGSNTAVAAADNLGDIDFKGSDGSGNFNLFAKIRASVDGTPGGSDAPGRLSFFTTADGGISNTEKLRITSGGQVRLPTNGQQLTFGSSQQMKFYYENSEERMYLQGDGAYGFAIRVNSGNRIEISKTTGDVVMQGASGRNFQWDNSEASLYLTDSGSGSSARLKIGSGGDLQLYHDTGGANHITCATNQELKISANKFSFYDYTGVTQRFLITSTGEVNVGGDYTQTSRFVNLNGGGRIGQLQLKGTEADLWLHSTGPNGQWRILGSTGQNTHCFRIYDQTNTAERLRINSSGNISIGGNFSAGRKVHIKDSGQIKLENTSTGGWAGLEFMVSSGTNNYDAYMGMQDSNGLFFIDNNSNGIDLCINQGGKVFIGADFTDFSDAGTFFNIKHDTYGGRIGFGNNTASAGVTLMEQLAYWGTNKVAGTVITAGTDTTNKDDAYMRFYTNNGSGMAERMRINESGYVTKISQPRALVKIYSTTTISSGKVTNWATPTYNVGDLWDTTNKRFVAPVDGLYLLGGNFRIGAPRKIRVVRFVIKAYNTSNVQMAGYGGGVGGTYDYDNGSGGYDHPYVSFTNAIYLQTGQYLELHLEEVGTQNTSYIQVSNEQSHMWCVLLQ